MLDEFFVAIILVVIAIVLGVSRTARIVFCGVVCVVGIGMMLISASNALAEDEIRTSTIVEFDLEKGEFILEDEDGFQWAFALDKGDYALDDEYTLVLPENGEPWCYKAPSAPSLPVVLR